MHRFTWDLHLTPVPTARPQYPIAATPHDTAPVLIAPWVPPGQYIVQLTVDGHQLTQPLNVAIDPRVKTPIDELRRQYALSRQVYDELMALDTAVKDLRALRAGRTADPDFDKRAAALEGEAGGAGQPETLNGVAGALRTLLGILQSADAMPNDAALAAIAEKRSAFI